MIGTLRYALDRLTLYLPAVLMAMFALGSWWLVRSLPSFVVAPTEKILRHEPDYFLHNFSIQSFDAEGRLTRELQGDQARHFPDTDMLDINAVQLQSQNPQGQRMHASAARALAPIAVRPSRAASASAAPPSSPDTHTSSPAIAPERLSDLPAGTSPITVTQNERGPRVVSPPMRSSE